MRSRLLAPCCTTHAGPGTRRRNSVPGFMLRSSIGAHSRASTKICLRGPASVSAEAPEQPPTKADEPTRSSLKETQTGVDASGSQGASQKRTASQKKASADAKPVE